MPGKVNKRGFKKLPNSEEVAVLVDDGSGSEIELLDMTDLKNHRNGGLNIVRDGTGSSCCSWFVPLYMVLLTFLLVLLTIFQLYVAYNVQLLRSDVEDITTQVSGLEDDLSSLQLTIQQMNQSHNKELVTVTGGLQKQIDGVDGDIKVFKAKVHVLETIQKQQIVDQVKKFNNSLAVIYSFAQEVDDIHKSIAELASTVSSLDGQVKKVKETVGDTATTSDQMSEVVQKVQDTLTVLQGKMSTHEKELSAELAGIHYQLGNMTQEMDSMGWMDQASLSSFIETVIANSSNLSTSSHHPSEVWPTDLANLEGKVDELQIQTDSLTTNVTSLQKSVSFLESTFLPLTEHIHDLYPPSGKKAFKVKNSTTATGNNSSVSTDTQTSTSSFDKGSEEVMNSPGSSKQPAGKQNESIPSTESRPSEEIPERMKIPGSIEDANIATRTVIPTPTVSASFVGAHDSGVAFASSSPASSNTMNAINPDEMEMFTRSAPKPTSSPSADEDSTMVTHPNHTNFEQSEDANRHALNFVLGLLSEFPDLDHNEDGLLSADELSQVPEGDGEVFRLLDTDHSGGITKDELSTIIDHLQKKLDEKNGGIDKSWKDDLPKPEETEIGGDVEDEEPTSKDDSFHWQDYV